MIISFQDFRDEECFIPRSIFLNEGIEVNIVSTKKGQALGSYGGIIDVDMTIDELNVSDYDAIVFVGGSGAVGYADNEKAHEIAKQAKVLGAICIAPTILARSGVLKGKRATVWSTSMDKGPIKILEQEGAKYESKPVVIDDNIVTANGPNAARKFGEEIVRLLKS